MRVYSSIRFMSVIKLNMTKEIYSELRRAIKKYFYHFYSEIFYGRDYTSEILFWENHLAKKDEFKDYLDTLLDKKKRKEAFPLQLELILKELNKQFKNERLRLLEVGSGPTSNLAWGVDEGLFEITAIDPLANIYNRLMKKNNYDYPIKPIKGTGEEILKLFDKECFHIVFSQNAIDHIVSPKKCILNMYKVLKKRGVLYLCGHVKEGTNQGWLGLHQHDLVPTDGQLFHFNSEGISTNLTGELRLESIHTEKEGDSPGDRYIIVFKKL